MGIFNIGNDSATHNIIVNIQGVNKEYYKVPFSRQMDDLRKVEAFMETAKTVYVKGPLVKQWIKKISPSEYYAKWMKDSSSYIKVYYRS